MMLPKLTRIDAMTLWIVTGGKLLYGFAVKHRRCEDKSSVSLTAAVITIITPVRKTPGRGAWGQISIVLPTCNVQLRIQ